MKQGAGRPDGKDPGHDRRGQALSLANVGGPYRFMYYLPGTNAITGSTWDDVSVVAVR